ncbi:MAG: hypothetical protein ABJM11_03875 [Marinobacter sp.]|uniref:hypothetical protein n=1 Tax=Marinobacter sp. TaxID=50741 RepID=UPI00329A15D5
MNRYIPTESRAHGDAVRAENRRRVVDRERTAVDRYLDECCRDILLGQCQNPLPDQRVDRLFAAVKEGVSGYRLKLRHNHLASRLQRAAYEHNLDLPNQQRMIVLHGESAPVTPLGFEELAAMRVWVDRFWSDLETRPKRDDADERKLDAGQLLFSFIVFGGVHSRKKRQLLIKALSRGVWHLGGLTWIDVDTGDGLWRWFPDPVSLLLLQRWYKRYGRDRWPSGQNSDSARLVFNYLRSIDCLSAKDKRPNVVLRTLSEVSATRDATWLEGVLHHIQRSHGTTVSLPEGAWARLLTKRVPPQLPENMDEDEIKPVADLRALTGRCDSDVYAGIRAIQKVLNHASRKSEKGEGDKTYQQLTAIAEDHLWAPIVRVLASWTAHLRRYGGRQGRLVTSSIQRYVSTIANPLATILSGARDLNALGEDEWEGLYEQLCSSASSAKRRSDRAIVSGWFHEYMVKQFGMPEVEIEGATVNGEVDADMLTPAEYVRAQSMLAQSGASRRLIQIRQTVLMLGFRCGLRRTEVQKLLIKDLQGLMAPSLSRPELLTRGNKFASQKSGSGTRRLPLWALLTETELVQLKEWFQCRLNEPNTRENDLLFCTPQRGSHPIPQRELFVPIQEAMRAASGTGTLRFHHLRHSCVTLVGVRLFERRTGEFMRDEWAKDDDGNVVMPHWGRDIFAMANRAAEWAPTRKKLWFLALLAGHASPGQTLRSYTHLMDYIIGVRQADRRLPTLTPRAQANLLGVSPGSVEVFRNRNGLKGDTTARELASIAHRRWPAEVCRTAGKNLIDFTMPDPATLSNQLDPEPYTAFMIYESLLQFNRMVAEGYSRDEAIQKVAGHFDLDGGTVEKWLDLGDSLMRQRIRAGSQRSGLSLDPVKTSEMVAYKNGVGGVSMPELPQCPAPPKSKLAHGIVEDVFERVRHWIRAEPEHARVVLQTVSGRIQRSKTQVSYTLDEEKRRYLEFLEKADLMHLVKIRVRAPENGRSDREIKKHWSNFFHIPQSRVAIVSQKSQGDRYRYGSAQVEVRPEPKLGKGAAQNTMSTLRFAVFMLTLACAKEGPEKGAAEGIGA